MKIDRTHWHKIKLGLTDTKHETMLVNQLRKAGINGIQTQKLYPNPYDRNPKTADIYLARYKLAIHVDGKSHYTRDSTIAKDLETERVIRSYGHTNLRVSNREVESGLAIKIILGTIGRRI